MRKLAAFLLCVMFSLFLTAVTATAQSTVPLGTAGSYAGLAGDTITNTGATTINGDLGLSPGTSVTGAPVVSGTSNVANTAAAQAKTDLNTAWVNAGGRGGATILAAGGLNATLAPGVYKDDGSPASLALTGTLTLDFQGNPNAVFIFQSASTLVTAAASRVLLINNAGGTGCNVFWQLGSAATIASTTFVGTILAHDDISVAAGVTVAGRLLAGAQANGAGALTLNNDTITASACAAPAPLALTCPANTGQVGVAYSSTAGASGGVSPYTFSVASGTLTAGLTLNTSSGAITGTPTTTGSFSVKVTDSVGTQSSSCSITIAAAPADDTPPPPPPSLGISCAASTGLVGTVYSSAMVVTGQTGPYTFGIISGSVPPGLALNTSSGAITGTPTTPGSFSFGVRVTNSTGVTGTNNSCVITIAASPVVILSPDLTITKSHLGNFQQGGTGSYTLVASNLGPGGTAGTVTVSDTLPAGLTATAISGTGWNCTLIFLSCTRSDTLAAGASYAPITVTVNVANNLIGSPVGNGSTLQPEDILLSMKDGTVQWRRSDWTLVKIITSSTDGQAKGMALDAAGNLFVTHYFGTGLSGNDVLKNDPNGNLIGSFGSSTYDCNPASIVFDMSGNAYVGHADCSGNVFKLDSHGNFLARYNVAVENRGSSHILLGPDQCTLYYTSEAVNVKRFNVCTNTQMPNFNTAPLPEAIDGAHEFALLPGGGMLIADFSVIARLDASGNFVRTYNAPGNTHCWLGMALDTDGTSFWASNWCDSFATRFDLATGNVIESHVASDTSFMIKQIMVVPSGPGAVVINTAAVSGGGETNISNDSARDSTTIVTQSQAPVFSVNSTAFCVGAAWSLGVTNAVPNTSLSLMGTTNGQSWMMAPWGTTDANGSLSRAGTFTNGTQGSYTLRVSDGRVSNTIYFVVSDCRP